MSRLGLLLLLAALLWGGTASAEPRPEPVRNARAWLCWTGGAGRTCQEIADPHLDLNRPNTTVIREVYLTPGVLGAARPLMVELTALASSEVRWNGVVIGRNGRPGETAAEEIPGKLVATFPVPEALLRPGRNVISARLSSHHLWLPVHAPLHVFQAGFYGEPVSNSLLRYLPALLMGGLLAIAAVWFGLRAVLARPRGDAALLALIAAGGLAQLAAETARVFVTYTYPWHLARVSAIAALAAVTAVLTAAAAARMLAPRLKLWAPAAVGVGTAAALVLEPGFDNKAMWGPILATAALAVSAAIGAWQRQRFALAWLALAAGSAALIVRETGLFLDASYYFVLALGLTALLAADAFAFRRALAERHAATDALDGLRSRLDADAPVAIRDGSRTHRVARGAVLYLKGADDYCEVHLKDGATILASETLGELQARLGAEHPRIHKSYAVNAAAVAALETRPGGGRVVVLADGRTLPVGRSYAAAIKARLADG